MKKDKLNGHKTCVIVSFNSFCIQINRYINLEKKTIFPI